jgi:acyl-CoA thioester hydrolase
MAKTFLTQIDVRGYELDSFGHVNHGVYASYLEHARWKLLEENGILRETFDQWKVWPVVMKLEIEYVKPAFIGETLEIASTHREHSRASISFDQVVRRIARREAASQVALPPPGDLIAKARIKLVMVNVKGRPTHLPEIMSRAWAPEV